MVQGLQAAALEKHNVFYIQGKWLLALYAVVPILALIVIMDIWLFDVELKAQYLPDHPARWAYWALIFNLPHIIGSWVTFADKEYLQHYRRQFSHVLPIVFLLVLIVHEILGGMFAFVVFGFYTMYHVLSQQFGISMLLMGVRPSSNYEWWRWTSSVGAMFLYVIIFTGEATHQYEFGGIKFNDWCLLLASIFLIISSLFAAKLAKQAKHQIGVVYLWANVIMLFACLGAAKLEYFAFVVIIPRIVHDLTAFTMYAAHDQNRNKDQPVNYIYRFLSFTKLPYYILCPLVAICIAYPLTTSPSHIADIIVLTLTYFHYYFEAFIWKGQAPHRQSISIIR